MKPFPISEAVTDTAELFSDFAQSKGHTIRVTAAPETEIQVSMEQMKCGVKLTVANVCEKPPEGDLNRLFDRFYRPDASRTAATGGFGIGLSIAKSITDTHRGQIRVSVQGTLISFAAELK